MCITCARTFSKYSWPALRSFSLRASSSLCTPSGAEADPAASGMLLALTCECWHPLTQLACTHSLTVSKGPLPRAIGAVSLSARVEDFQSFVCTHAAPCRCRSCRTSGHSSRLLWRSMRLRCGACGSVSCSRAGTPGIKPALPQEDLAVIITNTKRRRRASPPVTVKDKDN